MKNRKPHILVVGSANIDMVIHTPQIPKIGQTILGGDFFMVPGGKGANQAVSAARLGSAVQFCCAIGDDIFGEEILENLKNENIDTQFVKVCKDISSGIAIIMVDREGNNIISVASGANMHLTPEDANRALNSLSYDIILLQLEIPLPTVAFCIDFASQNNIPIILNPAPAQELSIDLLSKVDILTPNTTEASILSGIEITDVDSAKQSADVLREKGVKTVIITLGSEGALLVDDHHCEHILAEKVTPIDTTAAGDAFNGALALAIAKGNDLISAVKFANKVAAISTTRKGAQPSLPYLNELDKII